MKKYLKQVICALTLAITGLSFSPAAALAGVPFGAVLDTAGNAGVCLGAACQNRVAGAGFVLNNQFGLPEGSILGIVSNLLFWLLAIFAILGVIGFVISGILYLLAGADEGNAEKGKAGMMYAIIGVIVGLSGFLILQAVNRFLGGADTTF